MHVCMVQIILKDIYCRVPWETKVIVQLGIPLVDQRFHFRHCSIELHCFSAPGNGFRFPYCLSLLLQARTERSICSQISAGIALKQIENHHHGKFIRFSLSFIPIFIIKMKTAV